MLSDQWPIEALILAGDTRLSWCATISVARHWCGSLAKLHGNLHTELWMNCNYTVIRTIIFAEYQFFSTDLLRRILPAARANLFCFTWVSHIVAELWNMLSKKLASVFYASVLLLMIHFVIKLAAHESTTHLFWTILSLTSSGFVKEFSPNAANAALKNLENLSLIASTFRVFIIDLYSYWGFRWRIFYLEFSYSLHW